MRLIGRLTVFLIALAVLGGLAYTGFAVVVGSDALTHPTDQRDCRTPEMRFGWPYEAINYDIADDALLRVLNPDMTHCTSQGAIAGTDVVTSDGVHIGGWYIPAASGVGPSGPTVVLLHGWGAVKSDTLKYAVPLHPTFNLVAVDLRNGGRSSRSATTFGVHETRDLRAILDWLVRTKHPAHIAVMGDSMGGATAALEAVDDARVEALILDSTHARAEDVIGRRLEVDEQQPSLPGTPAILFGVWLRTGVNLVDHNPVDAIARLGDRPLLLLHGAADMHDLPARSVEANYQAAQAAGVPVEMHLCPLGTHGHVIDACPDDWGRWSVEFLDRAFLESGGAA